MPSLAAERRPCPGASVASNENLPLPLRRFRPLGELVRTGGEQALHIQFPLDGSRVDVDRSGDAGASAMLVRVSGGVLPITMRSTAADSG
jgi:penicillin-binding protein 1C